MLCAHPLQFSHDTRHVEISLCRVFCATSFFNTIFQQQKSVSKTYKAKLSTAVASYVVEGKITFVAVVQKRWFWFRTESGTPQRIEVKKVSWINVYFQSIWLSIVERDSNIFKEKQSVFEAQKAIKVTVYTKWSKTFTVQNTFMCSYHLKLNLRVSMNHWSRLHVAVSRWFSNWLLKFNHSLHLIL